MNQFIENFHFIRPWGLFFIPVTLMLFIFFRKAQDPLRGWKEVMDSNLLSALTVGDEKNASWMGILKLTGWIVACLAITGPTWLPEPSPFADDPIPVMILLNAGETMDETDLSPSRIERAHLKITDFAEQRSGQPLGLIAYSGSSHLVLPPTRDTDVVSTMAAEIHSKIMPRKGDDLEKAIQLAEKHLAETGGSILIVTDSVTQDSLKSLSAYKLKNDVSVFFLAIAQPESADAKSVKQASQVLQGDITLMTADSQDILSLVRKTAQTPISAKDPEGGIRWAETGWWFTPLLALMILLSFRKEVSSQQIKEGGA